MCDQLACKFHNTDLAAGQVIDGIPWIKSAVADAGLIAKFVKGRSRVLAAFNKLRQAKNKTIAEEKSEEGCETQALKRVS